MNLAGIKRIIELEQLVDELQARVDELVAELAAVTRPPSRPRRWCTAPTAATSCPSTGATRSWSGTPPRGE